MESVNILIQTIVKQLFDIDVDISLTRPDPQFGDFSTNIAMQLAKTLDKNPREIAQQIVEKLNNSGELAEISIAGPGFINIKIKDENLSLELQKIINNPTEYGKSTQYSGKTIITEYSDPNPFKVLHVGHLYTSVVGDAISNLIEYAGGDVHRVNFGGDVGLHVAKTMWAITKRFSGEFPEKLFEIDESERLNWVADCYVEGTRAYEDDKQTKVEITALNKKIFQIHIDNDHDSKFSKIYWTCREWSYKYFAKFYEKIGTKFEKYYPESEVASLGLKTVLEQRDKGIFHDSDGAVIFVGEPYGLHTRVFVNREGLPTYEAKDIGLCLTKAKDYSYDESIIITANEQLEYMKVVIKSIEQFNPELAKKTKHITHGMVKLPGGVKMASRKGNFIKAVDVLELVADANEEAQGNRDVAPILGAIKYAFLKNRIGSDIIFEPSESVSLQGNSGPYLQYSLARANSIVKKASQVNDNVINLNGGYTEYEKTLLFKLTEYSDVINQATSELMPHILCTYLYELAQSFNRFYENSKVVGDEREQIRLKLVKAYSIILKNGLTTLSIPTPDRM